MNDKPYRDLNSYFQRLFGGKTYKITIDAGLTCPNRINSRGCLYCNERGSGTGLWAKGYDIESQIRLGIEGLRRKYKKIDAFIAYFQSYTNTYAPLPLLKSNWETIKKFPEIRGISVGTRPDCIDRERIELLSEFSIDYKVFLELGLQSINEEHLRWIKRGHGVKEFEEAVKITKDYPTINIVVHLIFGFPEQTLNEIKETALYLSQLGIEGVKIHLLYVAKGSALKDIFEAGNFKPVDKDRYIEMVCTFLEYLHPEIVIHRLTGDAHRGELIAPLWSMDKTAILKEIEATLRNRESYQGKFFKEIIY
ncbi:MAG: TIGR01212 family radical SAM protein [Thermodesulfovibrionales bacterium]|nr:TIGR01212 family radical SAM protein [Thermodesulfovibrionales bacterium]